MLYRSRELVAGRPLALCLLLAVAVGGHVARADEQPIRFGLQIRPILSEKCFFCHGPDEKHREAELRLDEEVSATLPREEGPAIAPGHPEKSQAWLRIISADESLAMPPPDSHRSLTAEQKELIKRWIEQGAPFGRHWAFEPLDEAVSKSLESESIDSLVQKARAERGLQPAPRAEWRILARRLSLDLTGLPPTPEAADALAKAAEADAKTAVAAYVDELLRSPHFGEHWARTWLDLARYADTKGYEKDLGRPMWLYRDWVIKALNDDMPFDQFTIEQIAGDLLPDAANDQIVATAFHRNTMTNDEGGTDNEEFRVAAVKDRVDTTIQVWMGLTVGCAKCHSHKYDPITHGDYYRFYAIFNQTEDADRSDDAPRLSLPTPEQKQQQSKLAEAVKTAQQKLAAIRKDDPNAGNSNAPAEDSPELAAAKQELKEANDQLAALNNQIDSVPVMRELPDGKRRTTRIHNRGNFLDPGEEVQPAVLPGFGSSCEKEAGTSPVNRLDAARWLVSRDNPLTPRVMANRIWARLFGRGLVETEEDFGSQGALPSHPELLDWLAIHYRDDCGWSLKKLLKSIVTSGVYQQAFLLDDQRKELDPQNVWLSRGARFRLTAEMVRDQALAVSGLLSDKIGGKSVMPPQPEGLWKSTYNAAKWETAPGEDRYRRGLYTYWKRTTPYPSMITFDAGSREVCQVRRISTNTPLQALVTLNDPVYLEAAGALAKRILADKADDRARAERGLRLALIRTVREEEIAAVVEGYRAALDEFQANQDAAKAFLKELNVTAPAGADEATFAAWSVAASVILNLDELLTRN
jgi:hypothetical protein